MNDHKEIENQGAHDENIGCYELISTINDQDDEGGGERMAAMIRSSRARPMHSLT